MQAWLVVNASLQASSFLTTYERLRSACKARGVELELKSNAELATLDFAEITLPSFVLFWDKDICLAYRLEAAGVPVFNSARTIELCDNKALCHSVMENSGLRMPKTVVVPLSFTPVDYAEGSFCDSAIERLGLPLVVKEACGSFGEQVYLAKSREELASLLNSLNGRSALLQEFIAESAGRDVRLYVVGGKLVAAMQRSANGKDFRAFVALGVSAVPFEAPDAFVELACEACRFLQADWAGVDMLFGEDGQPVLCEVNSNAQFLALEACTGANIAQAMVEHVLGEVSQVRRGRMRRADSCSAQAVATKKADDLAHAAVFDSSQIETAALGLSEAVAADAVTEGFVDPIALDAATEGLVDHAALDAAAEGLVDLAVFDPIAYIDDPAWKCMKPGLERIKELMARLGNPERSLRCIHIAGTNGKGSTAAFLASVLFEAGYAVGRFTSPAIGLWSECICVNGQPLAHEALTEAAREVAACAEAMTDHPTEFELQCAVAFSAFAQAGCKFAVIEAGMGGRLDSTNVLEAPELCVFTRISLDHTGVLGTSVREIAREKAGIVKAGATVISAAQVPEAREELVAAAQRVGCELHVGHERLSECELHSGCELRFVDETQLRVGMPAVDEHTGRAHMRFDYRDYQGLELSMAASYQPANAALAIEAVEALRTRGFAISNDALKRGLLEVRWPGRFEVLGTNPLFIVDGAHNAEGAEELARSLETCFPGRKAVFVIGVLADKAYPRMLATLLPFAKAVYAVQPPNSRALSAHDLACAVREALPEHSSVPVIESSIEEAVFAACETASSGDVCSEIDSDVARDRADSNGARSEINAGDIVCACGSLYSVSSVTQAHARWLARQ